MSDSSCSASTLVDVAIVGAGPTGLSCAIEIIKRGRSVIVFDKGCLVNSLYNYPTNLTFFTTPELLEIGDLPMTAVREKPTRGEALKYYRRAAEHYSLPVMQYKKVTKVQGTDDNFLVHILDRRNRQSLQTARKVIVATGYYDLPNMMNVPGEDLDKVLHYYREPHPFYDSDVAVIGAKNSAAITALELYRCGARVTLIHRGAQLSDKIKYWVLPDIKNRLEGKEIRYCPESEVVHITEDQICIRTPQGEKVLPNDFVLAMTGYHPDTEFLQQIGIVFDPKTQRPRSNPETLESDRSGIYLAGVIVAGMHTNEIFIENGRFHGVQIAQDIDKKLGEVTS